MSIFNFIANTTSIDIDTDPMEVFNSSSTDLDDIDGGYLKNFYQNIFQVLENLFIAGIAITITLIICKYFLSSTGEKKKEGQQAIQFKFGIFIISFVLIKIFNVVLQSIFSLL